MAQFAKESINETRWTGPGSMGRRKDDMDVLDFVVGRTIREHLKTLGIEVSGAGVKKVAKKDSSLLTIAKGGGKKHTVFTITAVANGSYQFKYQSQKTARIQALYRAVRETMKPYMTQFDEMKLLIPGITCPALEGMSAHLTFKEYGAPVDPNRFVVTAKAASSASNKLAVPFPM